MATLTTTGRNAACNAIVDLLDGGFIKIYTSGGGTLLATCTFGTPAFGNAGASVAGRADANAITSGTAGNSGTAAEMKVQTSASADIITGTVGTSGADANFDTTTITAGVTVGFSSFYVTVPAS